MKKKMIYVRKLKADINHNESLAEEGSEAENPLLDNLTIFVSNIDIKVTHTHFVKPHQMVIIRSAHSNWFDFSFQLYDTTV